MKNKFKDIEECIGSSVFNKQHYEISIPLRDAVRSLLFYINDNKTESTFEELLKHGVPNFQRDNDKWDQDMQIKFVENCIKGFVPVFSLFILEKDFKEYDFSRCQILDGLQRITAISLFLEDKLKIFDGHLFSQLNEPEIINSSSFRALVRIYRFDDAADVIKHYIDINENISHSKEDIDRAKSILECFKWDEEN